MPDNQDNKEIPIGQKMFDRPFMLLFAGLAVMTLFYTAWGLIEVLSLPMATLP